MGIKTRVHVNNSKHNFACTSHYLLPKIIRIYRGDINKEMQFNAEKKNAWTDVDNFFVVLMSLWIIFSVLIV